MTQEQKGHLRDMFESPGWGLFKRILVTRAEEIGASVLAQMDTDDEAVARSNWGKGCIQALREVIMQEKTLLAEDEEEPNAGT
jgi:hypothetical protein